VSHSICIISSKEIGEADIIAMHIASGAELHSNVTTSIIYADNAHSQQDALNNAHAIVLSSPTYFGTVSAKIKSFMDQTEEIWKKRQWQNKIAAAFTHSKCICGDKMNTLNDMYIFAAQHGMIWVGLDLLPELRATDHFIKEYQLQEFTKAHPQRKLTLNRLGSWTGLMCGSKINTDKLSISSASDLATAKYFGTRIALLSRQLSNYN